MTRLLQRLASADANVPLFYSDRPITAGCIRRTAKSIARDIGGQETLHLYTDSAALFCAGLLAAAMTGTKVRLPAHLQPEYLAEIGADRGAIVSDKSINPSFPAAFALSDGADEDGLDIAPDISLVFLTSGSTGKPKAVDKEISQLEAEASILNSLWGAGAGVVLATVSHQHIYGMLFRVVWPVLSGRLSADKPATYWEHVSGKIGPHVTLVSSPAHLCRLPSRPGSNDKSPGLIFSSGVLLSYSAACAVRDCFGTTPIEVLGSTETGGIAWRRQTCPNSPWTGLPTADITFDSDSRLHVRSSYSGSAEPIPTGDLGTPVEGGFQLLGRGDRVAKIEGRRVSLPRVEDALRANAAIADAVAVSLARKAGALGAIVELTSAGERQFAELGSFRLSRQLRRELATRLDAGEIPKHWRFRSIPVNAQGKRVATVLLRLFEQAPQSRFGRSRIVELSLNEAVIEIGLDPAMIWFEGHFPGEPILAGLAQIHMASQWSERLWGWQPDANLVSQLKFRCVLRPNNIVRLRLERLRHASRLKFSYQYQSQIASSGLVGGTD